MIWGIIPIFIGLLIPGVAQCATDNGIQIIEGEIKVIAIPQKKQAAQNEINTWFDFSIAVQKQNDNFSFVTRIIAVDNLGDAISRIKGGTYWKNGYLHVREECGGGNSWRCEIDQIFAIRNGRLVHIGEALNNSYDNDIILPKEYFFDIYDKQEDNRLTSHADAPGFYIALKENNNIFVVDLDKTWEINQKQFKANEDMIKVAISSNRMESDEINSDIRPHIMFNAILSKYCRRNTVYNDIMASAKSILSQDIYEIFVNEVTKVKPEELPKWEQ